MKRFSRLTAGIVLLFVFSTGCASRMPLRDFDGKPIPKSEVAEKKSNSNLFLFALGGGALSFGASFFVGSLVDRGSENDSRSALWTTTAIGTALGLAYFAHQGAVRDHNIAVESAMESRRSTLKEDLMTEQQRREKISAEREKLERQRAMQEAERARLLNEIKKRKSKN